MLQGCASRVGLLLSAALCVGCGSGEGVPDDELAGLVVSDRDTAEEIDVERAAEEPLVLARALAMPHHRVGDVLGSHSFRGSSTVRIARGDEAVDELSDQTRIDFRDDGTFHARLDNSADYGRDVYFHDGTLYLRPRYGKFHRRAPNDEAEPGRIRDEVFATLGAYYELLAPAAELSDRGVEQLDGRAARKIDIKKSPEPRERPAEDSEQRAWRQDALVRAVEGTVWLDPESGAPLRGQLSGTVEIPRGDERFEMSLEVEHTISSIGTPPTIEPPPEDRTVATHERLRELEERNDLLEGIAPPAARAPTPEHPSGVREPSETDDGGEK